MTENKFKVGDKARVINADNTSFDVGDTVTLLGFDRSSPPLWECQKEGERYNQWFYLSQLEHIGTPTPAPEIIVGGHMYRLVEPEAPEPKEGQVWKEGATYMVVMDAVSAGGLDAIALNGAWPGLLLHNRFNGKDLSSRPTFIAHSLREALESGKIKAEDL